MIVLFDQILAAVKAERYALSLHAENRLDERRVPAWQVIDGLESAKIVEERPGDEPNPTLVARQLLADGSEIEVVWA